MSEPISKVYLVDDDPALLMGLSRLLRSAGYAPATFASARQFMEYYRPDSPGCLVLDVSMPEISGPELQRWLMQADSSLPVIFLTGRGDIPTTVRAMKEGAVDFLTKPVNAEDLLAAIGAAVAKERQTRATRSEAGAINARLATLTPREREVLELVVSGQLNKQIAAELGTVEKTIKVHRARVMEKMGVQSLAELARVAERMGIGRTQHSRGPSASNPPAPV